MDALNTSLAQRQLEVLEGLLRAPEGDFKATLVHVCDVIAAATGADKIDVFLYDASRDSLVATGTSSQPLSALQRKLGLNVLQISNGGRAVEVFGTGTTYLHDQATEDPGELRGIKEGLGVRSSLGVALEVGGERRGVLLCASLQPGFFTADDARMAETLARWVGIVAHRAELIEAIARNAVEQGRRAGAEELVTVLAHDLRNYLAPLYWKLEAIRLRTRRDGAPEGLAEVESVFKSVGRLHRLVNEILDVARLDQGLFDLRPESVDLGMLMKGIADLFATTRHPVKLSLQPGAPIVVTGDPARLRQCLENILANAVQKSPEHASVQVLVEREIQANGSALARIEISDQGPGIPKDMLPRLFERYVSGERSGGGLGLGLYLAKRIAALHGGDLTAASAPGKGARFTLILPCGSRGEPAS
jgi:signal transduction histidine kinase